MVCKSFRANKNTIESMIFKYNRHVRPRFYEIVECGIVIPGLCKTISIDEIGKAVHRLCYKVIISKINITEEALLKFFSTNSVLK